MPVSEQNVMSYYSKVQLDDREDQEQWFCTSYARREVFQNIWYTILPSAGQASII